jgi:aminomethyltransferase
MKTGYQALREGAAWIDFSARGKIRVTGEDSARLLHAMTTNNVKELADGAGLYAFFLTDKGRITADAHIFRVGEEFLLDTEPETATKVYQHLDKYIIADDAYVTDETADWFEFGIEGPESAAALERLGFPVPPADHGIVAAESGYVARVAITGPAGFRFWLKEKPILDLPQATLDEARIVRLENGIPRYGEDISERYLVQETQALHAVHFSKGCYLGQEIVERVRSQGKVHRLLSSIRISGTVPPAPGTKLQANGAAAGEITSAVYSPALHEVVALAYLRTEAVEKSLGGSVEQDGVAEADKMVWRSSR